MNNQGVSTIKGNGQVTMDKVVTMEQLLAENLELKRQLRVHDLEAEVAVLHGIVVAPERAEQRPHLTLRHAAE